MPVEPKATPFAEAIDYLRQKLNLPSGAWTDMWEGMHARAFVVAGAMRDELVADLRQAVAKALESGGNIADFRRDFDTIVAKHGWSYNGKRGWRTGVIFNTNLRTAYAAGKWQQAQDTKAARPYLRYVAILDNRTRADHRHWHDLVLSVDDDWWKTHYPPNGWGCRCTVQTLNRRDLDRYGYQVGKAPETKMVNRTITRGDGVKVTVSTPEGIDPGWGYNVGEAAWGQGAARVAFERHGPWQALEAPGAVPPDSDLVARPPKAHLGERQTDEAGLRAALRRALGGDSAILTDPTGNRVNVGQAIVDHIMEAPEKRHDGRERYFPLIPEVIEDPDEIWVGFAKSSVSGRVSMRRRYVKLVQISKTEVVGLVTDQDGGAWSGMTFYRGQARGLNSLRQGIKAYHRGEGK